MNIKDLIHDSIHQGRAIPLMQYHLTVGFNEIDQLIAIKAVESSIHNDLRPFVSTVSGGRENQSPYFVVTVVFTENGGHFKTEASKTTTKL